MTYEYICPVHGRFEVFFKSFSAAEPNEDAFPCDHQTVDKQVCGEWSSRAVSMPLEAHLYGNPAGYHKPSATKRFNTKTVSQIQGNKAAVG